MNKYIDAHCHFDINVPLPGGDTSYVCNATTESDWAALAQIVRNNPHVYGAFGVHPWRVGGVERGWDRRLVELLRENPDFMIGEIGIDGARAENKDAQINVFQTQLEIAHNLYRTAHIHCVRANDIVLRHLRMHTPPVVVMHAFRGGIEFIRGLLGTTDVFFSYSDAILRQPSRRLIESINSAPMDKILVESDGAPAASADVLPNIINAIAKIKSMDNNQMTEIIYNNSIRMLKHGQITQNSYVTGGCGN